MIKKIVFFTILVFTSISCEKISHLYKDVQNTYPLIIMIVLDTTRWDHLTCYDDYNKNTSPNIDLIAKKGLVFTNAYTTHDATPQAHYSLFTGNRNIEEMNSDTDTPDKSLSYILHKLGYFTVGVSANPLVKPSAMKCVTGYDYFLEAPFQNSLSFENLLLFQKYNLFHDDFNRGIVNSSSKYINENVSQVLDYYVTFEKNKKPLFLFINFMDPHDPYIPKDNKFSTARIVEGFNGDLRNFKHNNKSHEGLIGVREWQYADNLSESQLKHLIDLYDSEIYEMDYQFGQLIKKLKQKELLDNSILIICADHGEALGEKGYLSHSLNMFGVHLEENFHIPLIIYAPFIIKNLKKIDDKVSIAMIAPTILKLTKCTDMDTKENLARYIDEINSFFPSNQNITEKDTIKTNDWKEENLKNTLKSLGYLQ